MRLIRDNALLFLLTALVVILTACPQHVSIGDLNSNPARYAGKEVSVAGKVTSSFGLLGAGAFQVDDGTGKIWVLSENYGVPSKGVKVGVTGRVTEGATVAGRSFAVALRQTQKPHY